jgi:hypothetical protein
MAGAFQAQVCTAGEATAAPPQIFNAEQARQALLLSCRRATRLGKRRTFGLRAEQLEGSPLPRQPRLSWKPSSGNRKRGRSGGKDGNHRGRSAEGGRRDRRGIWSSGSWPDASAPIG